MRMVNLAAVAALAVLVAGPALAGDPRGGGHPGGGYSGGGGHPGGGCGGGCGGGGHRPPPSPPHGGGFNSNINVNVNANANANAFAGGGAGGYFNARAYDVGGIRGRGYGGGTVYVGGGYGGDGGYYGGGAIYNEEIYEGRACASAPFGYVVYGFGRSERRPPACVATTVCRDGGDRGGRYGYSERRGCDGGRREDYGAHVESGSYGYSSYEAREEYYEESSWRGGGYGGRDCDCDHGRDRDAPYPPAYLPEPPRHEPPARPYRPERPRPSHPPRQYYSQEPGERG
ncbi:MAG: hypothetical protein KKC29_00615 [Alphaproteobacteria bacterium]|jgi:hypothetical protein|nr:hypothetical protein [Alphaproteobacteria bacterium]MBU2124728.1 hypothetical protein [Alphaproteobacteria bacterium]MBU2208575.1 hypothetical protein [Alphaproteobacteria bacterium]MBU2289589.1 hypothetical protein [Alphaproteobacteria bacterium]MBU2397929.1 hypothetical protein [Alphaproteobacteria bacterium]